MNVNEDTWLKYETSDDALDSSLRFHLEAEYDSYPLFETELTEIDEAIFSRLPVSLSSSACLVTEDRDANLTLYRVFYGLRCDEV